MATTLFDSVFSPSSYSVLISLADSVENVQKTFRLVTKRLETEKVLLLNTESGKLFRGGIRVKGKKRL